MVKNPVTRYAADEPTTEMLRDRGLALGLTAVGVTSAAVLEPARSTLGLRKADGLHGEMQFTYRNPARSTDPQQRMPEAKALVVAALGYGSVAAQVRSETRRLDRAGRIARYVWSDHYRRLNDILEQVAEPLRNAGFRAQVIIDSNHLVDRNVAWRAGLGWYGKNSNLLLPGTGSWYVLGSILTDAPLDPTDQPMDDGCGPCTKCLDDCPTKAIVAPGVVDARRCIAWLVQAAEPIPMELRVAVGDRIYGCDDCQEVCPPNRQPAAVRRADELSADIGWILSADDEAILARHGQWYIANRNVDVIRRSALVVLGNTAEPHWGATLVAALLRPYVDGSEPLLRNHAVWAARRLGLDRGNTMSNEQATSQPHNSYEIELPVCCEIDGTDVSQCPDPDLHQELYAPVETRFSDANWAATVSQP